MFGESFSVFVFWKLRKWKQNICNIWKLRLSFSWSIPLSFLSGRNYRNIGKTDIKYENFAKLLLTLHFYRLSIAEIRKKVKYIIWTNISLNFSFFESYIDFILRNIRNKRENWIKISNDLFLFRRIHGFHLEEMTKIKEKLSNNILI